MRGLVLVMLLLPARVAAHGLRTCNLEITEVSPGHALAHLQLAAPDPALSLTASDGCSIRGGDADALARTWQLDCAGTLAGHALTLVGLGPITSEAVVSVTRPGGERSSWLVRSDAPTVVVPSAPPSPTAVAVQFIELGIGHVLTGYDHLLFLLLLVLFVRRIRDVIFAETAFTLSHSVSFSVTALGWVHVSAPAAEACIALSLLFLAADIRPGNLPTRRRGAMMAFAFGLVHGLGFAGGLREIGLPDSSIGSALIGFGVGIEIGQVAFLCVVLVLFHLASNARWRPKVELGALYAVGIFSGYLTVERCFAIWTSTGQHLR